MSITPHETGEAATVDAPETATGDTSPTRREQFRAWRRTRPFWGGLVTIAAGTELFFSGQLDVGHIHLQFGIQGMQAMVLPIVLVVLGVLAWTMPVHRVFYGVIALVLSVYALIGVNLGGFLIGMILGIVGSVMTISWLPRSADEPATAADAVTAHDAAPAPAATTPAYGLDLTGSAPTTDDTLVLDDLAEPRPFSAASADTDAAPVTPGATPVAATTSTPPTRAERRLMLGLVRRTRASAVGAGVLATALGLGGLSMAGSGAIPMSGAGAVSDQSGLCVLDPLHLICPADDPATPTDDDATPAPSTTGTTGTTPTDDSRAADEPSDDATPPATDDGSTVTTQPSSDDATPASGDDAADAAPASSGTGTGTDERATDTTPAAAPTDTTAATDDATADDATATNGTTDEQSLKAAAADGVAALADELTLCLGEGKDLGASSDVAAPALTAHLSGSKFEITNSWYRGNTTLTRPDGSTIRAMRFTADKAVVPGFRLDVPAKADGSQGLVATSDSITMKGHVVLYATKFSGKLLGIPLTFTPECAPPGFIALPSMTDVKIEMVANTADSLSYDNPHQEVYDR